MFDEENTVYPVHVIGKLLNIDPRVLDKLLSHADAVVERYKKAAYQDMEEEEGNPIVPSPFILLKNAFRAVSNFMVSSYRPTHILYPNYQRVPEPWGHAGIASGFPIRTKISISAELAEAAVFYIERNEEEIMRKAGITAQELNDLRRLSGSAHAQTPPPLEIRP